MYALPTSVIMTKGHSKSAGSVRPMTTWSGSPEASVLMRVLVSSDSLMERLTSARG